MIEVCASIERNNFWKCAYICTLSQTRDVSEKGREALRYHAEPIPGKVETVPTKAHATQRDLALAYSPGVAEPCKAIEKDVRHAYKYTAKGNLVAVVTNGTAVLGLGNIGPLASKPVMEGKGLLFKIFAGIDVFDIEVDARDPEVFIETVKRIAPTFGGINLEDIKAPQAFEIEKRLREELDIPVMHDDQHGTAIISAAALKNALLLAGKRIDEVQIVVNGAGAAAISCSRLYIAMGAKKENLSMFDSKGVIQKSRSDLSPEKREFATDKPVSNLAEAMRGADVFIGLSVAGVVSPDMLQSMAKDPIVFAMANPDPEIAYDLAMQTRSDVIMATGRSDMPNQVNNVLGFPFIFRGALDVRATAIDERMKMAAVDALAGLARETVPDQVILAYNQKNLSFGRDYIIPKPFDRRLITRVSSAVAKAAVDSGIARHEITDWDAYRAALMRRMGYDNQLVRLVQTRAKTAPKSVVFTQGDELAIVKAAEVLVEERIASPILLGDESRIKQIMSDNNMGGKIQIVDDKSAKCAALRDEYTAYLWKKRTRKGITEADARNRMRNRDYLGAMMVESGEADAVITGYAKNYQQSIIPLFEVIGKQRGIDKVSSMMILSTQKGPLFMADTAIIKEPTTGDFIHIARMMSYMVKRFDVQPRIAFLSYSNFGASRDAFSKRISDAVAQLHAAHPDMIVDGEIQADFALNAQMHKAVFPFSKLSGKKANTFIFPDLASGNIAYKMIRELTGASTIGPIILGLNKPAHVLQLRASVAEIVNMASIAVVDAQERLK